MANRIRDTHAELEEDLRKDPEYRRAWERRKPLYDLAREIVERRKELGLTQAELATRVGMKQSGIARMESAEHDFRYSTLTAISEGLSATVKTRLVPALTLPTDARVSSAAWIWMEHSNGTTRRRAASTATYRPRPEYTESQVRGVHA